MLDELKENGISINDELTNRLYGPVGLDIGGETSEEIALSIISEIKAVFSQRSGSSLKERATEIHHRTLLASNEEYRYGHIISGRLFTF